MALNKGFKLALVLPNLGSYGGAVEIGRQLAYELAQNYELCLISYVDYELDKNPAEQDFTCYSLGCNWDRRLLENIKQAQDPLLRILDQEQPDMLFALGISESLSAIRACKKRKIPLICCDHGSIYSHWSESLKWRIVLRIVCAFANKIVSLTRLNAQGYRKKLFVSPKRLQVIPNWADPSLLKAYENLSSFERKAQLESKALLWFGRLSEEKGVDRLFKIAERILPKHPDWRIDIVGSAASDEEFEAYKKQASLLSINQDQLRFCGYASDKLKVYSSHSIVVLTSYMEGLPLVLLEAASMGLPAVSYDIKTGPADIIENEKTGFLVPDAQIDEFCAKLDKLMNSYELREQMGKSAHEKMQKDFSKQSIMPKWHALIEEFRTA